MPSYHGTLAAMRCLGAAGIPVTVAEGNPLVPALWSRFAARRVRCPDPANPSRFMRWLLEFGAREPGHVLYPTSDDLAWLYSMHRDELAKRFVLRHPSPQVTYGLLNKIRLRTAAEAAGISMPRTWVPANDRDFAEIETTARFPVVIKPQTQILFQPHAKGVPVWRPQDLQRSYAEFSSATRYDDQLMADLSTRAISATTGNPWRVVVTIESVLSNPLGIMLAQAADAALLCVRKRKTKLAAAQKTVELIGRDLFIGSVVLSSGR